MQLPTRSDISRVASLVVALEEKVDRIEETFEDFEYRSARPATEERVAELEERLGRVEEKLDRLLGAVEEGPGGAVRATEAARREAAERGLDLSQVEGSGEGGRITVEDVRR
ncbi:MAG: E3 binding domain-containing protein, partial [Rubrobacter sp.]|nr:E3 binding domain-containing protein [Rubrobacter sp.]